MSRMRCEREKENGLEPRSTVRVVAKLVMRVKRVYNERD